MPESYLPEEHLLSFSLHMAYERMMKSRTQRHTDTKDINNNRMREDATTDSSPFDVDRLDQLDMQLLAASDHMFEDDNDSVSTVSDDIYDVDSDLLDAQSGQGHGASSDREFLKLLRLLRLPLKAVVCFAFPVLLIHVFVYVHVSGELFFVVEFFACLTTIDVGSSIMLKLSTSFNFPQSFYNNLWVMIVCNSVVTAYIVCLHTMLTVVLTVVVSVYPVGPFDSLVSRVCFMIPIASTRRLFFRSWLDCFLYKYILLLLLEVIQEIVGSRPSA